MCTTLSEIPLSALVCSHTPKIWRLIKLETSVPHLHLRRVYTVGVFQLSISHLSDEQIHISLITADSIIRRQSFQVRKVHLKAAFLLMACRGHHSWLQQKRQMEWYLMKKLLFTRLIISANTKDEWCSRWPCNWSHSVYPVQWTRQVPLQYQNQTQPNCSTSLIGCILTDYCGAAK